MIFGNFLTKNKTNNLAYSLILSPPVCLLMRVSCDKLFAAQWNSEGETFYDSALKTLGRESVWTFWIDVWKGSQTYDYVLLPVGPITFPNRFICADMVYLRLQNLMHFSQSRAIRGLMIHESMWARWQLYKHNASRSVSHQNVQLSVPHNTHINNVMLHICCP